MTRTLILPALLTVCVAACSAGTDVSDAIDQLVRARPAQLCPADATSLSTLDTIPRSQIQPRS